MNKPTHITITRDGSTQVIQTNSDGMSRSGRVSAWLIAVSLVVIGLLSVVNSNAAVITGFPVPAVAPAAAPANAANSAAGQTGVATAAPATTAGTAGTPGAQTVDDAIQAAWDGSTTELDWTGKAYASVDATFVGDSVASPGDRVSRTLTIGNAGPSAGVMSVMLVVDQTIPAFADNPDFAQDIDLFWDVAGVSGNESFARLLAAQNSATPVAQVQVPQGASVPVTIGYTMSAGVTADRNGGTASTDLSFQVRVQLQGDTQIAPPTLVSTGGAVLSRVGFVAGLSGAGVLLVLLTLLAFGARRRCGACAQHIGRDDQWAKIRLADGSTRLLCGDCCSWSSAPAECC